MIFFHQFFINLFLQPVVNLTAISRISFPRANFTHLLESLMLLILKRSVVVQQASQNTVDRQFYLYFLKVDKRCRLSYFVCFSFVKTSYQMGLPQSIIVLFLFWPKASFSWERFLNIGIILPIKIYFLINVFNRNTIYL